MVKKQHGSQLNLLHLLFVVETGSKEQGGEISVCPYVDVLERCSEASTD